MSSQPAMAMPLPDVIGVYGALTFLAARCALHGRLTAAQVNGWFMPAVEHNCVRLFQNADGLPCAALIWARLSAEVSGRMIRDNTAPTPAEWISGDELWFMDILAPFGHGAQVARHIARQPPADAFGFARIGADGRVRKVVTVKRSGDGVRPIRAVTFAAAAAG